MLFVFAFFRLSAPRPRNPPPKAQKPLSRAYVHTCVCVSFIVPGTDTNSRALVHLTFTTHAELRESSSSKKRGGLAFSSAVPPLYSKSLSADTHTNTCKVILRERTSKSIGYLVVLHANSERKFKNSLTLSRYPPLEFFAYDPFEKALSSLGETEDAFAAVKGKGEREMAQSQDDRDQVFTQRVDFRDPGGRKQIRGFENKSGLSTLSQM